MSDLEDKLPKELKPEESRSFYTSFGEVKPQEPMFKIGEGEGKMITLSPPPPNPFETHGTLYSNGNVFDTQYGEKFDPLATVSEGRTRLIINLETLRKNPRCLHLVIDLLYASLKV